MGRFVIKPALSGVRFDLQAANYETIASSESYSTEAACRKGIASVIKNAPIAALEDQTAEGFKTEKNPKFEIYTDKKGEFRYRLKAKNGQIIAVGEGYKAKKSVLNGVEFVRKNAAEGNIVKEEA